MRRRLTFENFTPRFALRAVPCDARGFTMIEMMTAIVVLTILIALAAPSWSNLVRDQRVKTAAFDVYSSLVYARSEAIKRNANVDIVPNASDWGSGWRVSDSGGTTLKVQDSLNGINITGPGSVTITYMRDGRLSGAAGPVFNLKSSESTAVTARCVRVDLSGRPNIKVDTNNNPSDGCQ